MLRAGAAAAARRASPIRRRRFLVTDILADNNARARTFGLASALATRGFAAVKTGTSKDMRDNWCVGFTDRYTIGVWVGNASGAAMHDVSGVSGAAPVWQALARALHARRAVEAAGAPGRRGRGCGSRSTARRSRRATRSSSPAASGRCSAPRPRSSGARRFGITSPRDGSVFAIDPDIPPAAQRITFEGEHGTWVLDGKPPRHAPSAGAGRRGRAGIAWRSLDARRPSGCRA